MGTLEYVAPEQITGDPLDERSDVYSLGCVLYECLTGQSPFPRATDVALLWAHVHEEPTPPSKARPELPKELDTVLARALAKEPGAALPLGGRADRGHALGAPARGCSPHPNGARADFSSAGLRSRCSPSRRFLAFVFTRDSGGLTSVSANSVGVIDPASNKLVAEVPVGRDPDAVAVGEGGVWVDERRGRDAQSHRSREHLGHDEHDLDRGLSE